MQTRVSGPGQNALDQRARVAGEPVGERVERGGRADQHRRRHVPAAALGVEQAPDGGRVEGVGADAVDGVGGQHDQLAAPDGEAGRLDRPPRASLVGAVG